MREETSSISRIDILSLFMRFKKLQVRLDEFQQMWVYDEEQGKLVQKNITYVPGLYKIFDEILVNAADNKQRDSKMNIIKVDINRSVK